MDNCALCDTIINTEKELDKKAEALTNRVKDIIRPTIEYNNKKWEKFAQYCRIPLIGEGIFLIFNSPSLKDTFPYWNASWYKESSRSIDTEAKKLEELKQQDSIHWGNELVKPVLWDDPSAYYYPVHPLRRKDCLDVAYVQFMKDKCSSRVDSLGSKYNEATNIIDIEEHLNRLDREFSRYMTDLKESNKTITNTEKYDILLPDKYAFIQGGVMDRLHAESKVMDSATKDIVPKNQCNFLAMNSKIFFSVRPTYKASA